MDDKNDCETICCFCGKTIKIDENIVIVIYNNKTDESQNLYCHKDCLKTNIDKNVILYIFDTEYIK